MIHFLSDFADQAVILPLIVGIAGLLAVQGWPRGAGAWLAATAVTFGLVLVLKLVFLGCGALLPRTGISSPSGHTASAALLCGGLAARFVHSWIWVAVTALLGAAVIGFTRVALGVHTTEEVILAGLVGIGGAVVLHVLAGPPPVARVLPLAIVIGAVLLAMHGTRLPAEGAIRQTASVLQRFVPWCAALPSRWSGAPAHGTSSQDEVPRHGTHPAAPAGA